MWRSLLSVVLLHTASSQSPCVKELMRLVTSAAGGHIGDAERLALLASSSGQSVPRDAGKYSTCVGLQGTKYFLLSFDASLGNTTVGMGMGMCLFSEPSCDTADAANIVKSGSARALIPALAALSIEGASVQAKSPTLDMQGMQWGNSVSVAFVGMMLLIALTASCLMACLSRPPPPLPEGAGATSQQPQAAGSSGGEPLLNGGGGAPPGAQRAPRRLPLGVQAFALTGPTGTLTKLMELTTYKPTDCLNGVRVLSMLWIIVGHTFLMPEGIMGYTNPQDIRHTDFQNDSADTNTLFFFVISAQAGVDSFFFLGGFLLSLLTMRELVAKSGKLNIIMALFLRYFRLTPSLAFVMLVYYKILPYLAYGPFAPKLQESIIAKCDANWWSELTYTMNFVPFDSDKVCMGWTWYLGVDMFCYIIGIILLPLYYRSQAIGCGCVTILTLASVGVTLWLIYAHHLSVNVFDYHYTDYSYWAYSKPYTRIPAFFVGIVAAWLLLELERRGYTRGQQPPSARGKAIAFLASLLCLAIMLFIILIPATDHGLHENSWSDTTSAMYITFGRPLWAVCLAVITLLCYYDYMPILNSFLSHPGWAPFARLTYGAYLVHPLVIKLSAGNATQYYNFSGMDLFYRWLGNCACAFFGATVVWCLVERPIMTFTTVLLKRRPARPAPEKAAPPASQLALPSGSGVTAESAQHGAR